MPPRLPPLFPGRSYSGFSAAGVGLDVTLDAAPPRDPSVGVRAARDYGDVAFSTGRVHVRAGQFYFLPCDEAEPLIREGVLTPVDA